jgi:hypothetical protein
MGFVRKAAIVGSLGTAKAAGVKGKSKKERNAEANEKLAKIEAKRFKAEQKAAKEEQRAAKAQRMAGKSQSAVVHATVAGSVSLPQSTPASSPSTPAQGPPPGWYLDPDGLNVQRWWSGTSWSDVTQQIPTSPHSLSSQSNTVTASAAPATAMPETVNPPEVGVLEVPAVEVVQQGTEGDFGDDGESARADLPERKASSADQPLLFGQVACTEEKVTFVTSMWGQDQTHQVKTTKVGRKPIKIKQGKNGRLDMTVAPGALAMKGLTAEQCAANLIEIGAIRPDVSVDVPSTNVAAALVAGGVTVAIQVVS